MTLIPTPNQSGTVLLEVVKREESRFLYNNELVKELSIAEAKIQWGQNLGKYSMTLPSGGTINFERILDEGNTERDKVRERILAESEPPMFMIEW